MSQPSPAQESATARRRAQLILQVQSGALSVRQAARQMGLSRKSYYKWEQRALAAMVAALNERARGRPRTPRDPEKETLRQQVQHLREKLQVLEQTLEIRRRLAAPEKKNS
jgi:transposase-like protein